MTLADEVAADFASETAGHELTVLHDDGLYRHLRIAAPGTGIWSWELITWPGYLTITGDIGAGFTFRADNDMAPWFLASQRPNLRYWAEKLIGRHHRSAIAFDEDTLHDTAVSEINGWELSDTDREAATVQLDDAWDAAWQHTEHEYRGIIDEYVFEATITNRTVISGSEFRFPDSSEMAGESFTRPYLLACNAILHGLRLYAAQAAR